MPFRYGKACLTAAPILHVRVQIETTNFRQAFGYSADCLPPLWFDKDPSKSFRQNVQDLIRGFEIAREAYLQLGQSPDAAADLWRGGYARVMEAGISSRLNALTCSFGSSLLERAFIDALCRLKGISFFELLKRDFLGMETAKYLPSRPLQKLLCRHTVGLSDPLTVGEIPDRERLDDGLPQALEEDIEFYGLQYFKVKLHGAHDRDLERLSRLAALLGQRCGRGYRLSLDGNEQYGDLKDVERLLEDLRSKPYGKEFLDAALFLEQPLHRDIALDPAQGGAVARLSELIAVIIDESDDRTDSFEQAMKLGYRGVSHKNCKGIFKSLQNRAFVVQRNKAARKPLYFQTGEDLATVPVVPLQQDLASLSALGIDHAEKNGHHYYHGLDHLPPGEARGALLAHPDLYEERGDSVFLRIQEGLILLGSIHGPGYGYQCEIAFKERMPLEQWSFDRLGLPEG
jgi:hypothetical protein